MSIALKQSAGAFVKPVDDARLYNLFSSGQTGIVEGCEITHLGANQLQISSGWGICQGRMFTVEQETIAATVSASGQVNGRLLIHIDVSSENPASFQTQAAAELPDLTQEEINSNGTVFELELASYIVDGATISDLRHTYERVSSRSDNGFFIYTHSGNSLTGRGENGRFKASAAGTYTSFAVNGTSCAVKCGEDAEIELVDGAWYTFILDGNTINFKQGGAGLNFKIVGGTEQPASPKENTIWVNTDLEITGWAFDAQQPDNPETGNVWIKTGVNGNAPISAVKGKSLIIYPQSCMQWNGTEFISKDVKVYKNGQWITLKFWFLQGSEQYSGITGGWGAINTTGTFKSATADRSGLVFATTSYIARNIATIAPIDFTGINTLYFSIAACEFSGNAGNGYSMNMGVHTDRTVRWSVDSAQGWAAEKYILRPGAGHIGDWPVDTSSIDAEGYIQIVTHCNADSNLNVTIDEIYGV